MSVACQIWLWACIRGLPVSSQLPGTARCHQPHSGLCFIPCSCSCFCNCNAQGDDGTDRGARKIKQLHDNANYFRERLQQLGLHVLGDWDSPVMPIMVYHLCYISGISRRCLEVRDWCMPVRGLTKATGRNRVPLVVACCVYREQLHSLQVVFACLRYVPPVTLQEWLDNSWEHSGLLPDCV